MPRFVRKREEVEAVQCLDGSIPADFLRDDENFHKLGDGSVVVRRNRKGVIAVVEPGDWLIRKPDGFLVACWRHHFAETYETVTRPEDTRLSPEPGDVERLEEIRRIFLADEVEEPRGDWPLEYWSSLWLVLDREHPECVPDIVDGGDGELVHLKRSTNAPLELYVPLVLVEQLATRLSPENSSGVEEVAKRRHEADHAAGFDDLRWKQLPETRKQRALADARADVAILRPPATPELAQKAQVLLDALDTAEKLAAGGEAQEANVNRVLTAAARELRAALTQPVSPQPDPTTRLSGPDK